MVEGLSAVGGDPQSEAWQRDRACYDRVMEKPRFGSIVRGTVVLAMLAGGCAWGREYYDLRIYDFRTEEAARSFDAAMESAGVAALKKSGATTIGVFKRRVEEGKEATPERYLLLAGPSAGVVAGLAECDGEGLKDDEAVKKYLATPMKDPAFTRIESTLLGAFKDFPALADPEGDGGAERHFELRIYQSHNELKARLKVEMFNEGGELGIFRETGLRGVFFGEGLIGTDLPKLAYMLVHENDAEKQKTWDAFKSAPAWDKLKKDERYADTVSKIDARFLVAMAYSPLK